MTFRSLWEWWAGGVCNYKEVAYGRSWWWWNSCVSWLWWRLYKSTHVISDTILHMCCTIVKFLVLYGTTDICRRRQWQATPVLLPRKSHGRRNLVGCSPWGSKESDTTERLHFHFSLSHIGEGNGNPLQRSCLENPRDGEAWWAAIYGVAQSRTRLKRLSSSSSNWYM